MSDVLRFFRHARHKQDPIFLLNLWECLVLPTLWHHTCHFSLASDISTCSISKSSWLLDCVMETWPKCIQFTPVFLIICLLLYHFALSTYLISSPVTSVLETNYGITSTIKKLKVDGWAFSSMWKACFGALPAKPNHLLLFVVSFSWSSFREKETGEGSSESHHFI